MVAVNPSGTAHSLALHATCLAPSGHQVTTLQLPPHSGTVLVT
jgi:hypothetical protein